MKAVLQRVTEARAVDAESGEVLGEIGPGVCLLICTEPRDGDDEAGYFARKIANMRIFDDTEGKMNRSVLDVGGEVLAISQFTLAAQWRKGNRPSFSAAADPDAAEHLYDVFCERLADEGVALQRGRFRTHMRIELKNDGPVTIIMDSAD